MIIRDLLTGPQRFTELRSGLQGISPKTLFARLRKLVAAGLVTRTAYAQISPRVVYQLTPAGERLDSVFAAMIAWTEEDLPRIGRLPAPGANVI